MSKNFVLWETLTYHQSLAGSKNKQQIKSDAKEVADILLCQPCNEIDNNEDDQSNNVVDEYLTNLFQPDFMEVYTSIKTLGFDFNQLISPVSSF